ncbi:DUF1517 domain-containing protein [Limnofasciculus baicalensis]|uniref:DUF1517 domain-containing protein n=1 Tax=Limnofasciculus baicalensis BBK-W-15 TaxID=2699891 RepID=A0AAE3GWX5_9CYAN|nr:DUF1517 domain-containing protein [Limnofasciculus baicalensis]MCP2731577.1 DUF1517 domain-containing protein [Limnofasciculus baicalensis BBK-W-15]
MRKKLFSAIKPLLKSLVIVGLIFTLVLSNASDALARGSGGRIGGGSFRMPSRSYSAPSSSYSAPVGGGYGYGYGGGFGGGFGFPFLLPFFGFGGFGSIFGILIFIGIANFLFQTFRRIGEGSDDTVSGSINTKVSVARVQVGLLAEARNLQPQLDALARTANTSLASGRAQVIQEVTLALLRHPEYWVYGAASSQQTGLDAAEAKFNQLSLAERSKFSEETLSNFSGQLREGSSKSADKGGELVESTAPSEYIIVTIVVGAEGKLSLPTINSSDELGNALREIGGISSERLLAIEVLWTPQAEGDTLTTDDILAGYPDLKLV